MRTLTANEHKCILPTAKPIALPVAVPLNLRQWLQSQQNTPISTNNSSLNFTKALPPGRNQQQLPIFGIVMIPESNLSYAITVDNLLYRQRWEEEIYNRFREAKKRFPEFFPCFELKEFQGGLQYSIHFQPLTERAKILATNNPVFPSKEQFKPIQQLWCNGKSELDILFASFPTQLALKSIKVSREVGWWKFFGGVFKQMFGFKRIGLLLAGNKV